MLAFFPSRVAQLTAILGLSVMTALATPAQAATSDPWDGDWHGSITPYVWLPGLKAETTFQLPDNGGTVTTESEDGLLSKLEGAFMLEFDLRKGRWGVLADVDWVKFSDHKGRFVSIGGDRLGADVALKNRWSVKGGLVNLAGLYTLAHGEKGHADLLFGVRHIWLKGGLKWDFGFDGPGERNDIANSGEVKRKMDATDAVIGLRGRWTPFGAGSWYFPYHVDIGAGESDNTYQFIVGAGYQFDWGGIALNYREVRIRQDDDDKLLQKGQLSGPALSFTWRF